MNTKQQLFENVGGNKFKLLTENISESKGNQVRGGLKKVFSSADREISYNRLQSIGLGYIREVSEAMKFALQEAKELAPEFGYKDDQANAKFIKEETETVERPESEEKEEVQIGENIITLVNSFPDKIKSSSITESIKELAEKLISLHKK